MQEGRKLALYAVSWRHLKYTKGTFCNFFVDFLRIAFWLKCKFKIAVEGKNWTVFICVNEP